MKQICMHARLPLQICKAKTHTTNAAQLPDYHVEHCVCWLVPHQRAKPPNNLR